MSKKQPRNSDLHFAVLAADVVLATLHENQLFVRVMNVDRPPYFVNVKGFPGGLVLPEENTDESAVRLIREKGEIAANHVYVEQLYTFSAIDRDPRGRVVSVAYLALVPWEKLSVDERAGNALAQFVPVTSLRKLAYDHDEVLAVALARLRSRVRYTTLIQKFLPDEFTLTELEMAYESVIGYEIDKRNFRKKYAKLDLLEETPHMRTGGKHRPARLYRFRSKKVLEVEVL